MNKPTFFNYAVFVVPVGVLEAGFPVLLQKKSVEANNCREESLDKSKDVPEGLELWSTWSGLAAAGRDLITGDLGSLVFSH